jgi:S-DNA-T family DNA segregation ATPase FtsK/SpoIIIE
MRQSRRKGGFDALFFQLKYGGNGRMLIFVLMAKRSKTKKSQESDPDKLKPEKEEKITVKQLIRDERTHKIMGAVFLLFSAFLFLAFTSYLFNWREDQDKVFQGASILSPTQT